MIKVVSAQEDMRKRRKSPLRASARVMQKVEHQKLEKATVWAKLGKTGAALVKMGVTRKASKDKKESLCSRKFSE